MHSDQLRDQDGVETLLNNGGLLPRCCHMFRLLEMPSLEVSSESGDRELRR
jgi:hypothetical protein